MKKLIINGWLEAGMISHMVNDYELLETWILALSDNNPYDISEWPNENAIKKGGIMAPSHPHDIVADNTNDWLDAHRHGDKPNTNLYYIAHVADRRNYKSYKVVITKSPIMAPGVDLGVNLDGNYEIFILESFSTSPDKFRLLDYQPIEKSYVASPTQLLEHVIWIIKGS